MIPTEEIARTLPDRIARRLKELEKEIETLMAKVDSELETRLPGPVSFRFEHAAPSDVLTVEERAQSVSFVARYEGLPVHYSVELAERQGCWYIANMPFLRYVLNDYRPLIQNRKDAVHYQNVHNTWYRFLQRLDSKNGLCIRAFDTNDQDVTSTFSKWLGERNRAIMAILATLECDYLYNGILQHSDVRFADRFLKDYVSGELNYLLWKHVHAFDVIREMLSAYHMLLNILTFPKLGPL